MRTKWISLLSVMTAVFCASPSVAQPLGTPKKLPDVSPPPLPSTPSTKTVVDIGANKAAKERLDKKFQAMEATRSGRLATMNIGQIAAIAFALPVGDIEKTANYVTQANEACNVLDTIYNANLNLEGDAPGASFTAAIKVAIELHHTDKNVWGRRLIAAAFITRSDFLQHNAVPLAPMSLVTASLAKNADMALVTKEWRHFKRTNPLMRLDAAIKALESSAGTSPDKSQIEFINSVKAQLEKLKNQSHDCITIELAFREMLSNAASEKDRPKLTPQQEKDVLSELDRFDTELLTLEEARALLAEPCRYAGEDGNQIEDPGFTKLREFLRRRNWLGRVNPKASALVQRQLQDQVVIRFRDGLRAAEAEMSFIFRGKDEV